MNRPRLVLLVLALTAATYPVVALQTPPGFYEGFCPPVDYRFLTPPPQVRQGKAPASAHAEIKVVKGVVNPGFVATADDNPQAQLSFVPGAFQAPADGSNVVIDIKPVRDFPGATGLTLVTNVYQVSSSTPMIKASNLRLLYSTVLPAPSTIYEAQPGGLWQPINSNPSSGSGCTDVVAQVSNTGLFAAGYPGSSSNPPAGGGSRIGGGQTLPIIAALAILIVVLAGIPLAVVRRRRPGGQEQPRSPDPPGRT